MQPTDLTASEISVRLGATWLEDVYKRQAGEIGGANLPTKFQLITELYDQTVQSLSLIHI